LTKKMISNLSHPLDKVNRTMAQYMHKMHKPMPKAYEINLLKPNFHQAKDELPTITNQGTKIQSFMATLFNTPPSNCISD
tara:strand:+ start:406 stop:645 length:240 start_codon:yes stop_codon:yes gene_type:complete